MKRIRRLLLCCVALLCGLTAAAQDLSSGAIRPFLLNQLTTEGIPFADASQRLSAIPSPLDYARSDVKRHPQSAALRRAQVVTDTPQGTLKQYMRSGGAWMAYLGYLFERSQDGMLLNVVYDTDGKTVWFQDLVSQCSAGTWVKGTLADDGKSINVPLGQCLYWYDSYSVGYELAWVDYVKNGSMSIDQTRTSVNLLIADDGSFTVEGASYVNNSEYHGLGVAWTNDHTWVGYMDYDSHFKLFENVTNEAPPAGTPTTTYSMTYGATSTRSGKLVEVATVGDDYYVKNIHDALPDAWIKGTKSDETVTFKKGQYMGLYGNYLIYLMMGNLDTKVFGGDLGFAYNTEKGSFKLKGTMILNAGTTYMNYLNTYLNPEFAPYSEQAATPSTPRVTSFTEKNRIDGYNYAEFYIPISDTEGNFINPEKLTYIIYVDDETQPFTFRKDEYAHIDNEMTEVPYNYSDGNDIQTGGAKVVFYETGYHKIGIQSVYYGQGERRASDIAWYNIQSEDDEYSEGRTQLLSHYKGDESTLGGVGTGRAEAYDVATYVQDDALDGVIVTGMRIPVAAGAKNIKSYKGWLSRQLRLATTDGLTQADPDIISAEATPDGNWVELTFDKPYTIGTEGFYAGYSFVVDEATTDDDQAPVVLTTEYDENGYWLHTSRTYRSWTNRSDVYQASAAVVLKLAGNALKKNAAIFAPHEVIKAVKDSTTQVTLVVVNHGVQTAKSIDYSYEVNGKKRNRRLSLGTGLDATYFGQKKEVTVSLPAISEQGEFPVTFTINKVNGVVNEDATPAMETTMIVSTFLPTHRPLMEEYTGTWCGWCTRGLAALEAMNERHPDDFVALAYHNSDPMEIMASSAFPSAVSGFPSAWLDRVVKVDPYYGTSSSTLGIEQDWLTRQALKTPADIEVEGVWADDAKSAVDVTSRVRFLDDADGSQYRVEYVLVADGMYGKAGTSWDQHNYYAGSASSYPDDPYLLPFCNESSTISGYSFNEVVLKVSGNQGVAGSVPTNVEAGAYYAHTYRFNLADVKNTSGESLIQNLSKLRVVAILLNASTGEVVNCNKGSIVNVSTGIHSTAAPQTAQVTWFDLQGRRLQQQPRHGLAIKSTRMTDGSIITQKVICR